MSRHLKAPGKVNQPPVAKRSADAVPTGTLLASPRQLWPVLALFLLLGVVALIRVRLLNVPLERDEGEYGYAGQLLLGGIPPYLDLYSMKWPGTFAAYAVLMGIFGQTIAGIHLGLLTVSLLNALLVFFIARRICGLAGGMVAAGTTALLSLTPASFGLAGHATHFVLLPALAGILVLQSLAEPTQAARVFGAGLLLGLAALMKQAGAAFGVFAALWLAQQELVRAPRQWRRFALRMGALTAGGLLPLLMAGALLALAGVFSHFWLWTMQYSRAYAQINSAADAWHNLVENGSRVFLGAPGLWCLALAGIPIAWLDPRLRQWRFFLLGFAVCSWLAVCPAWYFRGHYFLLVFPALGLLAGIAVQGGSDFLSNRRLPRLATAVPVLVFAMAAGFCLYTNRAIFFQQTPVEVCRSLYALNPFPESLEVGRYLQAHTAAGARIGVVGSEPQLYFYSHRRSATGYIYTYPLMEPQPYAKDMQREMIAELEETRPEYFVFVGHPSSWLPRPDSDTSVVEWFIHYRQEHLESVGLVETFPNGHTESDWSGTANPRGSQWLQIYKRKPEPAGRGSASPSNPATPP